MKSLKETFKTPTSCFKDKPIRSATVRVTENYLESTRKYSIDSNLDL